MRVVRTLAVPILLALLGCAPAGGVARQEPRLESTPTPAPRPSPRIRLEPGNGGGGGPLLTRPRPRPSPGGGDLVSRPGPRSNGQPSKPKPAARVAEPVVAVSPSNLALRLPGPADPRRALPEDLRALRARAEADGSAASWRAFADAASSRGHQAAAAEAYGREAAIYRATGDLNAALVEEAKARENETVVEAYLHRPATAPDRRRLDTGARLEPAAGCYLGAFVDRDDSLPTTMLQSQIHGDVAAFGKAVGRPHASFFMYRSYGQPFPSQWARYLKSHGAIPHIAWEPKRLEDVRDDPYLRDFAEEVRRLEWPVFLRFAGEMNGDWTPYHGNPAAYREAFRRVHRALRAAPQAALIWCPNTVPQGDIEAYYPGDDAVDWVGVNFYSVPFEDDDPARPADRRHPADFLDFVYRRWSARKPIAVGEWAASHQARVDPADRSAFAVTKIAQLYESLPTRYPRVKLVNWYDCNNLVRARPGRQLNNYLLTDRPEIASAYTRATGSGWFLGPSRGTLFRAPSATVVAVPLEDGARAGRSDVLEARVRTHTDRPSVLLRVDGRVAQARQAPGGHRLALGDLAPGDHRVEVLVYDGKRCLARLERRISVGP